MATIETAPPLTIVQPRRPLSGAERQAAYRARKRAKAGLPAVVQAPEPVTLVEVTSSPSKALTSAMPFDGPAATPSHPPVIEARAQARWSPSRVALRISAVGLALVGLSMNAVYARSLGSSDLSGYLFLALGLCADLAALALPTVAVSCQGVGSKAAAWAVWSALLWFAILGSVGFASTSISDVTMARNGRVTPQVTAARDALADAMAARDRECKSGTGKFCREREQDVVLRRSALDTALGVVATHSDPQAEAVTHLVTWISRGNVTPSPDDVSMIRLALLALLPQVGGILLMVGRRA